MSPPNKYKQILIVGPNIPQHDIQPIRQAWDEAGLREGTDYVIIGDGDNLVPEQTIDEALKHTSPTTHIHYSGHGITKDGIHTITITEEGEPTVKLLETHKDVPGIRHVWSCHCGAAHEALTTQIPDIPVILHSGGKYAALGNLDAETIASVGVFCQQFEKAHGHMPNANETVAWSIVTSPETLRYTGLTDSEGKAFKVCATKQPTKQSGLEHYLESQLNDFDDRLQEAQQHTDKVSSALVGLLPDNITTRYLELALIMEAGREFSKHGTTYVNAYLTAGVNPNCTLMDGTTSLYMACEMGNVKVVEKLLAHKDIDVNKSDMDGTTPLYIACQNGHTETVEKLLAQGADVNQPAHNGITPLYTACQQPNGDVVNLLLEKGASIHKGPYGTFTPLMVAALTGQEEIIDILLKHPEPSVGYLRQVPDGNTAEAFCNNKGIDIPTEHRDLFGKSAAEMAREEGHDAIADKIETRIRELTIQKYTGRAEGNREQPRGHG